MVSLLQISDGHHHGDTTELRASSQTSSSVVASSLKPSTLQPFSLPYCQRTDFHSFQSHPPMPLNCPHSASFFFFLYRVWSFLYRVLILCLSPPRPNCSAWTSFHLSFQQHTPYPRLPLHFFLSLFSSYQLPGE